MCLILLAWNAQREHPLILAANRDEFFARATQPFDFVLVVVSAIVICFVATIYPSRQASRLDPVQALRFE